MTLTYEAMPTETARAYWSGGPDAYGKKPDTTISDGVGVPCRHCLKDVPKGQGMLVFAHRPFAGTHAYAETGPIFLCARPCEDGTGAAVPAVLRSSPDYLIRGYDADERIVYGTGGVITADALADKADSLLDREEVVSVHVRSARTSCYLCRIVRR